MPTYQVHIYREMRLVFPDIAARTADEAAQTAAALPAEAAQALEDCDGENLAALVLVSGHEEGQRSRLIDFDPVRAMAPELLQVLELILPVLQEIVCAHRLRDDAAARLVLDRVVACLAQAHAQPL